jgi:peptidoglycan/xylan/chitin deacetylase (PgdA/CDA1 family)
MGWTCRRRSSSQVTVKSFPAECEGILGAGHEIAHQSYAHVDPSRQSPDEERADLQRALAAPDRLGVRPLGYRSPSADMSPATLLLLEEHGLRYDSSLMGDDFRAYPPRIGGQEQAAVRTGLLAAALHGREHSRRDCCSSAGAGGTQCLRS